jgi:hypothetical protein
MRAWMALKGRLSCFQTAEQPAHGGSDCYDRRGENRQPDNVVLRTVEQENPFLCGCVAKALRLRAPGVARDLGTDVVKDPDEE